MIFPALLLLLLGALFDLVVYFLDDTLLDVGSGFQLLRLTSATGTHGPLDPTCAVMLAYWPYVESSTLL